MNGAEKIKNRIIADATSRADTILEDARQEAQDIIKSAEKKAFQRVILITEKAKEEAVLYKQRFHAAGGMEDKKEMLRMRQDTINEAFNNALNALANLPENDYRIFLEEMLLNVVKEEEGYLVLNKKDKERLGQPFIEQMNEKLKAKGKNAVLKLAEGDLNSLGGFIIQYGEMEINCTLEVILNMARPNLEAEVAHVLFSE